MKPHSSSRGRLIRQRHRTLIHRLNQRYRLEFVRAERLQAELNSLQSLPIWPLLAWLRRMKRWFASRRLPPPESFSSVPCADLLSSAPPPSGLVSIVIPFKNDADLLHQCLTSLRKSTYRNFEVILVDNGSTEPRMLRYLHHLRFRHRYRVIASPGPFHFARLCNIGAHEAQGDYLLLLNNDTAVLTRDWLEQMLRLAAQPQVGVVGAMLLYPDYTIQHAGIFPRRDGVWIHPYRGLPADALGQDGELQQVRTVPAVTGACLLIRRDRFLQMGGLSEAYPITHNDVDLCQRIREQGLGVVLTPHARLMHWESLSRGYSLDSV